MGEVTTIDDRHRIRLPKGIVGGAKSVLIIDAGSYFIGIPISSDPLHASASWLKSREDVLTLKKRAQEGARRDAFDRSKARE